jgi:AraC-like DNA-binding protein
MKKQSNKRVAMMTEDDHGLGINRRVPRAIVEELDQHIMNAATVAINLGVSYERLNDLFEAAFDVAACRYDDEMEARQ